MRQLDRLAVLVVLGLLLPACEEDSSRIEQLAASWMEWLAEVQVEQPLSVLIVGIQSCGATYVRRYEVDWANATILFNPYQVVPEFRCETIQPVTFADKIDVLGLAAGTYRLQSGDRVFGEVVVTVDPPDAPPLNGSGSALLVRDPDSCLRLRPATVYGPHIMPLQDQSDTTSNWLGVRVTGHIIRVGTPVCGQSRVFQLLSKN